MPPKGIAMDEEELKPVLPAEEASEPQSEASGEELGEIVPFTPSDDDVTDTDDGGAIVKLGEDEGREPNTDTEFYSNLADGVIDELKLSQLATEMIDLLELDKEARKKRDEQQADGLKRTGLGDEAPGGADFEGASKVVHPMITEACIDFAARAMKELSPSGGPVKDYIPGAADDVKLKKARRKVALMNWQLTTACPDFRSELEKLLTQVPLGGAQYLKVNWSKERNRPTFEFVPIDNMLLPFAASSFYTAERRTHVQRVTDLEFKRRMRSGMYREVDLSPPSMLEDDTASGAATLKIAGKEDPGQNKDGQRTIYEIETWLTIEDDEDSAPKPYLVSIDDDSRKVLAIYRNWSEEDTQENPEALLHCVEWPFIPWRDVYPIGLPHMIGGLSAASTGALRALLDSAHIQNVATMVTLKSGPMSGQNIDLKPGTTREVDAGLNVDDIRKAAMPLPFNPPSTVLFQLLGFLGEAARGVVRTTFDDTSDQGANAPVGTTLARIEQGLVVFSAIHGRLHTAMYHVLRIVHRLNGLYLDDSRIDADVGEDLGNQKDFNGPIDVIPVSDPEIFAETQRFAQVQAITQRAAMMPQLYDLRAVEEMVLRVLKVPNADELLVPATTPTMQNSINENVAAVMGRPIIAFPQQDHLAHLEAHLAFLQSPLLGSSPLMAPTFLPIMVNHVKEHVAMWYASAVLELANLAAGEDVSELLKEHKTDEERMAFDRMVGAASVTIVQEAKSELQSLPEIMDKAMEMLKQYQMPPPMDPTQAAMAETQRKTAADQQKAANDQQSLQVKAEDVKLKAQKFAADQAAQQQGAQLDAQALAQEGEFKQRSIALQEQAQRLEADMTQLVQDQENARKQAELASRERMNEADNRTAKELATLEVVSDERFGVSTGTGINPNP